MLRVYLTGLWGAQRGWAITQSPQGLNGTKKGREVGFARLLPACSGDAHPRLAHAAPGSQALVTRLEPSPSAPERLGLRTAPPVFGGLSLADVDGGVASLHNHRSQYLLLNLYVCVSLCA